MAARVLVGTCGWADPSLVRCGRFYPPSAVSAAERLRFYARNFELVEVDSTYYALPSERNAGLWAERTPPGFLFDVKAFSLLTHHPTPARALPASLRQQLPPKEGNYYYRELPAEVAEEVWRTFEGALLPLDSAGKLGVVLFQFPPWFLPGRESTNYIREARERLPQYRTAVEFRSARWFVEDARRRTLDFLRHEGIPYVCVDEPQGLPQSVPPLAEVTGAVALVRFHGRNREAWARRGATVAEKYDYLYREEELREWIPRVEAMGAEAEEVHLLFNNCHEDKAVRNARELGHLLGATPGGAAPTLL